MAVQLFKAQTTNGDSTVLQNFAQGQHQRERTLIIQGTWNGATVTLYVSADGVTFVAPTSGAWTADTAQNIVLSSGLYYKLTVSAAGGSTSLNAWVV